MSDRLTEIEARLKAAMAYDDWVLGGCSGRMIQYKGGGDLADVDVKVNAELIVHAPADLAWAVAEIRRLREGR